MPDIETERRTEARPRPAAPAVKLTAPEISSNLLEHDKKLRVHNWGHRARDIRENAKATWTRYEGEEKDVERGYSELYKGAKRLIKVVAETRHAHKVRQAERTYMDALKSLESVHVKVELDAANEDQKPIFDLIKKVGISETTKNPYFIMELKGQDNEETGTYVAYDPKLKKYVMYWQKKMLLGRFENALGVEGWFGAKADGRLHFKDEKSYKQNLARKAAEMATEMLQSPVEYQTDERKRMGFGEHYSNRFGMFAHHRLTGLLGFGIKVPEGISIIERDNEGKLVVQGTPYLNATAHERMLLEQANRRRINRERELAANAERAHRSITELETRLTAQHYRTLEVTNATQVLALNEWFNTRTEGHHNLRNRNVSIVYRDDRNNDVVVYGFIQNGQRQWRVGVPDAIATGYNTQALVNMLDRVPTHRATFNQFNALEGVNRPRTDFTLIDPESRTNEFDPTTVQFRVCRGGGMFRLMHPDLPEERGPLHRRMVTPEEQNRLDRMAAERTLLRTPERARENPDVRMVRNQELRDWLTTNDYVAHNLAPLNQAKLTRWFDQLITERQKFLYPDYVISMRSEKGDKSGVSDLILHSTINPATGVREWRVFTPRVTEAVDQAIIMRNVMQTEVDKPIGEGTLFPSFIVGAKEGKFANDTVQIAVARKGNAEKLPRKPGVGIQVIPPAAGKSYAANVNVVTRERVAPTPVRPVEATRPPVRRVENAANVFVDPISEYADRNGYQLIEMNPTLRGAFDPWISRILEESGANGGRNHRIFVTLPLENGRTVILQGYGHEWNVLTPDGDNVTQRNILDMLGNTRTLPTQNTQPDVMAALRVGRVQTGEIRNIDPDAIHIQLGTNALGNIAGVRVVNPGEQVSSLADQYFATATTVPTTPAPIVHIPVVENVPKTPPVEEKIDTIANYPETQAIQNEYFRGYARSLAATALEHQGIKNSEPTMLIFKDAKGQTVKLLIGDLQSDLTGDSVRIADAQSTEDVVGWTRALAGNATPPLVGVLDDAPKATYNQVLVEQDAKRNVKVLVAPATIVTTATQSPQVSPVPAPVSQPAPVVQQVSSFEDLRKDAATFVDVPGGADSTPLY